MGGWLFVFVGGYCCVVYFEFMLFLFLFFVIVLMIGVLIDIIIWDNVLVKYLLKMVWIIIVILLLLVGSLLWFVIGWEYGEVGILILWMWRFEWLFVWIDV